MIGGKTPKKRRLPWKKVFLAELEKHGSVAAAAKAEGVRRARSTVYNHRKKNKKFAIKWDEAIDVNTDMLEAEAVRRAMFGVNEPRFVHKGKGNVEKYFVKKYSDRLLLAVLRARRPEKWGDHQEVKIKLPPPEEAAPMSQDEASRRFMDGIRNPCSN